MPRTDPSERGFDETDQSRTSGQGVIAWCQSNLNADFVPPFASGHATIHE